LLRSDLISTQFNCIDTLVFALVLIESLILFSTTLTFDFGESNVIDIFSLSHAQLTDIIAVHSIFVSSKSITSTLIFPVLVKDSHLLKVLTQLSSGLNSYQTSE